MSPEEIRLRAMYLFLTCSQAVEQFTGRLAATLPAQTLSVQVMLHKSLKRELGLLFRYWTTRQIWERLEANEADAKQMNLVLLRLFTDAFKLPRDGSGLRYAELSTLSEEVEELGHRITNALGMAHEPLLVELQAAILPWRDAVTRYTIEALELPLELLAERVKEWAVQPPEQSGSKAGGT